MKSPASVSVASAIVLTALIVAVAHIVTGGWSPQPSFIKIALFSVAIGAMVGRCVFIAMKPKAPERETASF
ncbi:MAG: hypothetical protein AB7G39_04395 [Alphaproteobacteria bacterium]